MADAVFLFVPRTVASPYINHFLQPDTIIPDPANPQALNKYSYVMNRPVNFSDPTGHCAIESDSDSCGLHRLNKNDKNKDKRQNQNHQHGNNNDADNQNLALALIFADGFSLSQQQTIISLTEQTGLNFEGITFSTMEGAPSSYVASGSANNIAINSESFFSTSQSEQLFTLREEFGHHLQNLSELARGAESGIEEAAKNFAAGLSDIGSSETLFLLFLIPSKWKDSLPNPTFQT